MGAEMNIVLICRQKNPIVIRCRWNVTETANEKNTMQMEKISTRLTSVDA
jgi:hypothetical protein